MSVRGMKLFGARAHPDSASGSILIAISTVADTTSKDSDIGSERQRDDE